MKHFLIAAFSAFILSTPVLADSLMIKEPWSRETPAMAKAGAAFMTIKNSGDADKIVGAKANVSEIVELHTHIHEDGIMRMREVKSIDVPAGGMAELKPGGLHIMLIGLKAPLEAGTSFPLTLTFEKGGEKTVDVSVKKISHMGHGHDHGAHDMKKEMKGHMHDHKDHKHGHEGHKH